MCVEGFNIRYMFYCFSKVFVNFIKRYWINIENGLYIIYVIINRYFIIIVIKFYIYLLYIDGRSKFGEEKMVDLSVCLRNGNGNVG